MEAFYIVEAIVFTLILIFPIFLERYYYAASLTPREKMIVDFTRYKNFNYLSISILILAAIAINLYPRYALFFIAAFLLGGFIIYTYKQIFSYLVFKKEQFPKYFMCLTILKPVFLLLAIFVPILFVLWLR